MSDLTAVNNQVALQVSTEQVELIKRTVAKGATDDELQMFLHLAQAYNLDPFAKEIWFIKRVKKIKTGDSWDYPRLPNGEIDYSNAEAPVIVLKRQFGISGLTTKEEMSTEYELKNVTEHKPEPAVPLAENKAPQLPQQVGEHAISLKGVQTRLSEMTMKQLEWLKSNSKSETTRAMASAYIDELNLKGQEIEAKLSPEPKESEKGLSAETEQAVDNPAALFGGAAL